jgi:hypothetical protein
MSEPSRRATANRLERVSGQLATIVTERMEERLDWFRRLRPEDRSWIGLVVQSAIAAFIVWFRDAKPGPVVTADVFGTAPRELTRAVSLHQTVEIIRVCIDVVESKVPELVTAKEVPVVQEAILRYSREMAFAAAEVYARAAELRGAWDARLEALLVDSVLRGDADESVRSRAAALGWSESSQVTVVVGRSPDGDAEAVVELIRRDARHAGLDVLTGVQGDRTVVILGGVTDVAKAAETVAPHFGPGPVIYGPLVADLVGAAVSARAAIAGLRAAPAWPDAPRPVGASDLLPERALSGDGHARHQLVTDLYTPVAEAGPVLIETLAAFLETGGSVEATARLLFVHANTVRYRLRRIHEVTGYGPTDPRDAYTLRMALTLGRLLKP